MLTEDTTTTYDCNCEFCPHYLVVVNLSGEDLF